MITAQYIYLNRGTSKSFFVINFFSRHKQINKSFSIFFNFVQKSLPKLVFLITPDLFRFIIVLITTFFHNNNKKKTLIVVLIYLDFFFNIHYQINRNLKIVHYLY